MSALFSRTCNLALIAISLCLPLLSNMVNAQAFTDDPRPIPRTPDGHVSFAGDPENIGNWNGPGPRGTLGDPVNPETRPEGATVHNLDSNLSDADIPFLPWARELFEERVGNSHKDEPYAQCKPTGGPRLILTPYGNEWLHLEDQQEIIFLGVGGPHTWRRIHMDGRAHPENPTPTRFGHSVGHWEDDTLVIDSVGFTTNFWLGRNGYPHTEQLHLIETISRPSFDRLHYVATVDDPGAYTETWSGGFWVNWLEDNEPFDYLCQENNISTIIMTSEENNLNDQ